MPRKPVVAYLLIFASGVVGFSLARAEKAKPKAVEKLGIDESALDTKVAPCDDFYEYACGSWLKRTEIPADRAAWGRGFAEVEERNQNALHDILEGLVAGKNGDAPYADRLSAFYGSCMDEPRIEAGAEADVKALLAEVDKINSLEALSRYVSRSHSIGSHALFALHSQPDFKDATFVIADIEQAGLGLPDRDYYLKDDSKFPELRKAYVAHVEKMLTLAGLSTGEAQRQAQVVMTIEKQLAAGSLTRVERREPKNLYHRLELKGVESTAPRFHWKAYLAESGTPNLTQINVESPAFLTAVDKALTSVPLADWRVYLRWHTLHAAAPALSQKFVDEDFAFYGKTLEGTDKLQTRWKRCVKFTDHLLGEALARPWVKDNFGEEGKTKTRDLVGRVEAAMEKNLATLGWMDVATRAKAFEKLHAVANKIGFPDRWRNYDALKMARTDSFLSNAKKAGAFMRRVDLDKIGKPVDKNDWEMTPPTVNAYYEPLRNEMVFPAGILQPPFFNKEAVAPVNYGAIGMVMGHELTHGFDDEGRQFDAKGNLVDWWTPSVNEEFEKRAMCVVKQFDGYTVLDNLHLNGKLTLGENIADLGGVKLAHAAYKASKKSQAPVKMGQFTDDQLFFIGYAQAWCTKRRDELTRMRVTTDPHSPPQFRVNGPLSNLPEFRTAFSCKPDSKMVRKDACVVW
jgi:endothelin-converting enzyme/putative endopeptidase